MAENPTDSQSDNDNKVPDWVLAKRGLKLLINNNGNEAKQLFLKYPERLPVFSGYSYAVFMDALMSFEEDKLQEAINVLKEVDRKCSIESSWLKTVKSKVLRSDMDAQNVETQIILADSLICMSVLSFLQHDFGGFFKGGWMLRRAWKIYSQLYKELLRIYEERFGEVPDLPVDVHHKLIMTDSNPSLESGASTTPGSSPNMYIPSSHSANFHDLPKTNPLKKSQTVHSNLSWSLSSLSHLTSSLSLFFQSSKELKIEEIDEETVKRLMGATAFGYGLLQLGVSLLPPSLFKLSNILGFSSDRQKAIACLMYARKGVDMRAPLATLSLLWYHTIVRPYYVIDGSNVQLGAKAAMELIEEIEEEYGQSALFLFFKGRVSRLNSDIPSALVNYQLAVEKSNQREVKILSLHEVGWCHLIQLEFSLAGNCFDYLKTNSRWSRGFYSYLNGICAGCSSNPADFRNIEDAIHASKGANQLDSFLLKRTKLCIKLKTCPVFWRFLVYEMLYLWNALPSCNQANLEFIKKDCELVTAEEEPMKGLSKLIYGVCCCMEQEFSNGVKTFQDCLRIREGLAHNCVDAHISAFSQYELGNLLLKNTETRTEGKLLLQNVSQFKEYDFETRLNVRVHSILKQI